MSEPYLILHKVRGEPAFDVAERLTIGEEEGWVIPTSGYRAYPYRKWELESLADISDINSFGFHVRPATIDDIPEDWPDHYSEPTLGPLSPSRLGSLLSAIGLGERPVRKRRV